MKKTILALAAVSTCAFASPFRGMGSNLSENLVSARFGKVTTTSATETKEKGDGDIVDSIPKEQINTRPTLADLNRNVRTGASVPILMFLMSGAVRQEKVSTVQHLSRMPILKLE